MLGFNHCHVVSDSAKEKKKNLSCPTHFRLSVSQKKKKHVLQQRSELCDSHTEIRTNIAPIRAACDFVS